MSLPVVWIDKIFAKLVVSYGHEFLRRWEGMDMATIKSDWAEELGGYVHHPHALVYALNNLPADKPPTAKSFRAICNAAPAPKLPALTAPVAEQSAAVGAKVAAVTAAVHPTHPREWAHRLKSREERCDKLTLAQREMWRDALKDAA